MPSHREVNIHTLLLFLSFYTTRTNERCGQPLFRKQIDAADQRPPKTGTTPAALGSCEVRASLSTSLATAIRHIRDVHKLSAQHFGYYQVQKYFSKIPERIYRIAESILDRFHSHTSHRRLFKLVKQSPLLILRYSTSHSRSRLSCQAKRHHN